MKQLSKSNSTLLFIILTGVLIVVTFISHNRILQYNKSVEELIRINKVKNTIQKVQSNLKDAEIEQRGYLLTGDSVYLKSFTLESKDSNYVFDTLELLIRNNPQQQENLNKLKSLVYERYAILDFNVGLLKNRPHDSLTYVALQNGRIIMNQVRSQILLMLETEDKLLVERTHHKDRTASLTPVFLLSLSLLSILVITFFFFRLQKETGERITITESNKLLQESKEEVEISEKRFRTLAETIPQMMWEAFPDGKKYFFNKFFLDYTGLTFEELEGEGWHKIVFPVDLEREILQWNEIIETGDDFIIEKRLLHHSGEYRWHITRGIAQKNNEGNIVSWLGTSTEIDDQKKITEVLAKAEEQLRTFANSIQNLAWIANADGWIYWYNQRWYDYTGCTLDDMQGVGWQKVHHPDHLEEVRKFVNEAWKKNEAFELTFPLRRHDGEYRWFLSRAYPVNDDAGNIERWIGTNTDITEQRNFTEELEIKVKERTAELEERKNFVETILEASKEYITVYAIDFTLLSLNKATEALIGKKREELLGKKLLELFPKAKGAKAELDLQSAFNGNTVRNEAYPSSVTGRYIENYITPLLDSDGNIYAALGIANDVTNLIVKQKEVEASNYLLGIQNQTFEIAEKIATLGSYKWNLTTNELEYSNNLFRLLDCEPQEFKPSVEKFLSFIHPDDLQEVIKNQEQTIETESLVETPYRIISKTGVVKYFHSSGDFYTEGANRLFIGTVQDISADIVASRELKVKNMELENANAELASFNYVASHDLQEPLRKIQAFSKRIINEEDEHLSDNAKDYFKRINAAARRMQNLITSILSYSRTNSAELVFEKTNLNKILNEVKLTLQESIKSKNVVIESQELPTINAIPVQMHQLFLNLISNSIKYAKQDVAPLIKITAEEVILDKLDGQVIAKGTYWRIAISDNGIGFEQQYEDRIFEVFQRLHGKTEYEGTGIGLAICKKIVQVHHGAISGTGNPGVGAMFTFLLPANGKA